jgi:HEAT repeat protein
MMHRTRPIATIALLALGVATASFVRGDDAKGPSPEKERELVALLRSDAPPAEKALACKHLAVHGTKAAVPELAKLLSNEQLASWARIPLEAIPGAEADEALRKAATSLKGNLLVGAINSIGVRRDAGAVETLASRLKDPDAEVASAAAVALGRIGNTPAAKTLRQALAGAAMPVRSAIAEGCVLCAEQFHAAGNSAEAVAIYDEVRKADVPLPRKLEATRGAILARKQEGIPLLIEQLQSPEKGYFQIALSTAREFPGSEVDKALAAELERAVADRAALLILAMADRPRTVVLPAVLKAAGRGPMEVRVAAIGALGRIGNASCLPALLEVAVEPDADVAQTAKDALAVLPGEGVNEEIVSRLSKAQGKSYPVLIELVGRRRLDAVPLLTKALAHSDKSVRSAALIALGNTVTAKELSILIAQVVMPTYSEDATVAQQALKLAAVRMPDREACAAEISAALDRSPVATKIVMLEILSAVGGTKALASVGGAAKSDDPQLQDAGSRLLGEWMTIDAAPVLLDLAKTSDKYHSRAVRGYIRIARQFVMPEPQRAEMCRSAMAAARQPADKKLVIEVLKRYPSLEMLKQAVQAAETPELKEDAQAAAVTIAQKLPKTKEVRDLLSKAGVDP